MDIFYEKIDSLKFWTPQLFISSILIALIPCIAVGIPSFGFEIFNLFQLLTGVFAVLAVSCSITIVLSAIRYFFFLKEEKRPKNIRNEFWFITLITIISFALCFTLFYQLRNSTNELFLMKSNLGLVDICKYLVLFSAGIHLFYTVLILIDMKFINKISEGWKEYLKIVFIMFLIFAFVSYFLLFSFFMAYWLMFI